MFPAMSKEKGTAMTTGPTDVCKTPAPPAPFAPVPYPNIAMVNQSTGFSTKVKVMGSGAVTVASKVPMSSGDEAGTLMGMVSSKIKGQCEFKQGSSKVKVEGKKWVYATTPTAMNGSPQNTVGVITVPSQTKVTVMP